MEEIQITIQDKKPYTGNAEIHPEGDFYCDKIKYTCWDKPMFDKYNIGDVISFSYTSKDNTYEGKTYTNRNISKISSGEDGALKQDEPTPIEKVTTKTYQPGADSPSSVSHIYKMGNLEYEITMRLIS